jgi:hypothetical protein
MRTTASDGNIHGPSPPVKRGAWDLCRRGVIKSATEKKRTRPGSSRILRACLVRNPLNLKDARLDEEHAGSVRSQGKSHF